MTYTMEELAAMVEYMEHDELMALISLYVQERTRCQLITSAIYGEPAGATDTLVESYLADLAEHVMDLDEMCIAEVDEWRERTGH